MAFLRATANAGVFHCKTVRFVFVADMNEDSAVVFFSDNS
jgi:hypothetical protein